MIKLTLVKIIRNFSLFSVVKDFNRYFFHGVLLLAISLLYVFVCQYIFFNFITREDLYQNRGFWEQLYASLGFQYIGSLAVQITAFWYYHAYFLYLIKKRKENTGYRIDLTGLKTMESYISGILILLFVVLVFGNGIEFLFSNTMREFGLSNAQFGMIKFINSILFLVIPALGTYLSLVFLRSRLGVKGEKKRFKYFLNVFFLSLIFTTFVNLFTELVITLIISPIKLAFPPSLFLVVITGFIYFITLMVALLFQTELVNQLMSSVLRSSSETEDPNLLDSIVQE